MSHSGTRSHPDHRTNWWVVTAACAAGVAAALQIGKASAALPLLRMEFDAGVAAASWYLALASLGAAIFGAVLGLMTTRIGGLRAGVIGLALLAVGSLLGPLAGSWTAFILARLLEAVGMPLVVVAMPALIQSYSSGRARVMAMGFWSAWLPLGVAVAMGLSVVMLERWGWRGLYIACGVMPLLSLAALFGLVRNFAPPPATARAPEPVESASGALQRLLRHMPGATVQIYGGVFALFSASYLTVQGFLPSVAVETLSMSIATATLLGGASALLVIPGNLVGSFLLSRGVSARLLLRFGFVVMGASGAAFLSDLFAPSVRIAAGCIFTAVAGVVPGVIWALIPQLTAQSRRGSSLTAGVVYQYAGVGQLLGPVLAGLAVQLSGGWSGSAFVVLAASGVAMLIIALPSARIMPEIAGAAPAR